MKNGNKLLILASLLLSSAISMATEGSNKQTSTVKVIGGTSASATGGSTYAYGRTGVDGTHVGPNGTTHFVGDTGAEAMGQGSANAQTGMVFSETRRTVGAGGSQCGAAYCPQPLGGTTTHPHSSKTRTSSVFNIGGMKSSANGSEEAQVWGDMSTSGNLTGPRGSSLDLSQSSGYYANGAGSLTGHSSQVFGATYRTTVGPRP